MCNPTVNVNFFKTIRRHSPCQWKPQGRERYLVKCPKEGEYHASAPPIVMKETFPNLVLTRTNRWSIEKEHELTSDSRSLLLSTVVLYRVRTTDSQKIKLVLALVA